MQRLPDINIICEKLAIAGVTRFEDRFKLPLGISVNMTSFAAKVLIQSVYNPNHGLVLMAAVGNYANLAVVDTSVLVEVDETLKRAYLPHKGVISLIVKLARGDHVQIAGRPIQLGACRAAQGMQSPQLRRQLQCHHRFKHQLQFCFLGWWIPGC